MRKLKLALLGIVSIFCLNSCVTTALSTLAGVAVAVCGENGCNDLGDSKKSNFGGIYVLRRENEMKAREYVKALLLRPKENLEIEKGVFVNVPKGFIIKNGKGYKYFYDKIYNIGFPFYYDDDSSTKSIYNNNNLDLNTELISTNKDVNTYKVRDKYKSKTLDSVLLKKLSNDKYIYIYIERDKSVSEFMEFYKDFMENLYLGSFHSFLR